MTVGEFLRSIDSAVLVIIGIYMIISAIRSKP